MSNCTTANFIAEVYRDSHAPPPPCSHAGVSDAAVRAAAGVSRDGAGDDYHRAIGRLGELLAGGFGGLPRGFQWTHQFIWRRHELDVLLWPGDSCFVHAVAVSLSSGLTAAKGTKRPLADVELHH